MMLYCLIGESNHETNLAVIYSLLYPSKCAIFDGVYHYFFSFYSSPPPLAEQAQNPIYPTHKGTCVPYLSERRNAIPISHHSKNAPSSNANITFFAPAYQIRNKSHKRNTFLFTIYPNGTPSAQMPPLCHYYFYATIIHYTV